jgi:quercetin dioxygenase-like cupin family protein
MVRDHQPGEGIFRSILPEEIDWKPFPAFPLSARLAVLVGEPTQAGPYVIRVKVPSGVKLMPHRHPEDRIYTVMSSVFYIGLGDQFDGDKVKAYPPGSVIVLPDDTWHFHWAKSGEYVTQVTAIGPLGVWLLFQWFFVGGEKRPLVNAERGSGKIRRLAAEIHSGRPGQRPDRAGRNLVARRSEFSIPRILGNPSCR